MKKNNFLKKINVKCICNNTFSILSSLDKDIIIESCDKCNLNYKKRNKKKKKDKNKNLYDFIK